MRIAIVIKDYNESKGGAERYLALLAPRLAREGNSIDLIVNNVKGAIPAGINVKKVNAITWSSTLYPLSFNREVRRLLKQNRYDIVYGLTQIYPLDVYRAGGGLEHSWFDIRNKKIWQRLINYIRPKNLIRLYIENKIFSEDNHKKIITNSNLCKYQILHHYKISPEDITVIYNGVSKDKFNPNVKNLYRETMREELGIIKDEKIVLFMSNNWKRKGLVELIKAFSKLEGKNLWLIVAGRGRKEPFVRLAEKLCARNKLKFVGATNEPEKLYGAGDIFVLPTYYDPCANVCIEALACGLPVVTTRANGASELIIEGKNGFVIEEPDDINALSDSIEKALNLGNQKIEETIKDVNIEINISQTIDVFKSIVSNKRKSADDILINDQYKELFKKKNWPDFESVMGEPGGVLYKKNNLRSVVKLDIDGKNVFLKRHFKKSNPSWALMEWQNIFRLKALRIPVMEPVAAGEKGDKSFIITESLEQIEKLEDVIKKNKLDFAEKKELIYKLACATKKLHNNRLFHKDYYTGHIFLKRDGHSFELYLIDLQRLKRHWLFNAHWVIKDLASLNFSSLEGNVTRADRIRFLKYYCGEDEGNRYREFIKKISIKTNQIAGHTVKLLGRRKGRP